MKIKDYPRYKKAFGFRFAGRYYFNNIAYKLTKIYAFKKKVFRQILSYLSSKYLHVLSTGNCELNPIMPDSIVWVFWWQGEKQMPPIVKVCYESIKRNTSHPVVLIDKDNFGDYVEVPDYILQKVENGQITLTHFSDILRACLLSKYGGLWADATIYLTENIDSQIDGKNFYTCKQQSKQNRKFVSLGQWTGFFMAGGKNNPLFVNLRNLFFEYWKEHMGLVEYFLIDYCIRLICDNIPEVAQMIDEVESNNPNLYVLADNLFKTYNQNDFEKLKENTSVFKLTWKFDQKKTNKQNTFYKKILEEK